MVDLKLEVKWQLVLTHYHCHCKKCKKKHWKICRFCMDHKVKLPSTINYFLSYVKYFYFYWTSKKKYRTEYLSISIIPLLGFFFPIRQWRSRCNKHNGKTNTSFRNCHGDLNHNWKGYKIFSDSSELSLEPWLAREKRPDYWTYPTLAVYNG